MSSENFNLFEDIYYSKDYVSLYLKDNEEVFEFEYNYGDRIFYNIAIKRPIIRILNEDIKDGYFDLETAYGYGGLYINTNEEEFVKRALEKYEEYCLENNIIAEFIRFQPWNLFPVKHGNFFDMLAHERDVVYVDLNLSKEDRWEGYSSKTRNILRKCERELIFKESTDINMFMGLYEKTMRKNHAADFYYFSRNYYEKLLSNKNIRLYEVRKNDVVVSMAIFMFSDNFGYYHLSGNNYDLKQHNGNYFILDQIFDVAKEKNIKYFLLGGGSTNHKDDNLLKFKKKFSPLSKPFYIAGKIYNKEVYVRYINIWENQNQNTNIKYFLKYRLEV